MAVLTTVADAIMNTINAQTWSQSFRAVRQNVPRLSREDAAALHVTVTPQGKESETITRAKTRDLCRFYVAIQKGLKSGDNCETDALVALGEEIQAYFDTGAPLTGMATVVCEETAFGSDSETPWLGVQDQDEMMLYTGIIRLTFRVHR